jgi:hypothetical protein
MRHGRKAQHAGLVGRAADELDSSQNEDFDAPLSKPAHDADAADEAVSARYANCPNRSAMRIAQTVLILTSS